MIDPICDDCYEKEKAKAVKVINEQLALDRDDTIAEFAHAMVVMKLAYLTPGTMVKYGRAGENGPIIGMLAEK